MPVKSKIQVKIEAQVEALQEELQRWEDQAIENRLRQQKIKETLNILEGCLDEGGETEGSQ